MKLNITDGVLHEVKAFGDACRMVIPEGVHTIACFAVWGEDCPHLQEVILPHTLRVIQYEAFHDCMRMELPVLPDGIQVLHTDAFRLCRRPHGCYRLPLSLQQLHKDALPDGTDVVFQTAAGDIAVLPEHGENVCDIPFPEIFHTVDPQTLQRLCRSEVLTKYRLPLTLYLYETGALGWRQREDFLTMPGLIPEIWRYTRKSGCDMLRRLLAMRLPRAAVQALLECAASEENIRAAAILMDTMHRQFGETGGAEEL